jgi:hypothetical protein
MAKLEPWKVKCKACGEVTLVDFWEAKDTEVSEPCSGCDKVITMMVSQRPGDNDPNTVLLAPDLDPNFELVWDTDLFDGRDPGR